MTSLAVLLLSGAVVAFEILLVRVFAIEQFHHVAYMAIGVAMLGFGASGTLLALAPPRPERAERWFARGAVLAAVAFAASPWLARRIPLDATQLLWDGRQWLRLGGMYALLALPFGLAGGTMLLALARATRPGRLYGASFGGAGLGAVAALAAASLLAPGRAVSIAAILAAGAALIVARATAERLAAAGAAALAVLLPARLAVSPYKAITQVSSYPAAQRVLERPGPVGWLVAVRAPAFRFAPGLSLGYQGRFPPQTALFVDGELAGAATDWSAAGAQEVLDWVPAAAPYALSGRRTVLVLGSAAGFEVPAALAHGVQRVVAVDLHAGLVAAARLDGLPAERVDWIVGDARAFVARSGERFDVIALGPGAGDRAGTGGLHALNEDFLHTVEAYRGDLDRLAASGVLAITRWLEAPPRSGVRVILTLAEALRQSGADVARALVVLRSWNSVTVLARPAGFTPTDVAALEAWCRARWFDIDWRPGLAAPAPEFHFVDDPVLFRAARAAAGGRVAADRFTARYLFRVAPASDARPYPHQFVGLAAWRSFVARGRGTWAAFAELGYVALVATLAQSALLAALLIGLPVAARSRRALPDPSVAFRRRRLVAYFAAIGLAYLAAEIAAIQQLTLLLGHPVYAVTAALAVMLACSGAGSAWSDRWEPSAARTACAVSALLIGLLATGLLPLVHAAQPAPIAARAALGVVALAPAAALMGMPFPLGLRALAMSDQRRIALAWASNGYASAVAAPLAALISVELGSPVLLALAALGYALAALLGPGGRTRSSSIA